MILAIVGSVSLDGNADALVAIEEVLDSYRPLKVVSGGAPGIDRMAIAAAKRRGLDYQEFLPAVKNWQYGFKPRNMQIAEACGALVRIVASTSTTYGSGWTRDYAASLGKHVKEIVILTDSHTAEDAYFHIRRQQDLVAAERFVAEVTMEAEVNNPWTTMQRVLMRWRFDAKTK